MTRKSILSVATALTILTASCGGNKENKETADNQQKETVANVDVHGQWYLENIVFSDSDYVRVRPDERLYTKSSRWSSMALRMVSMASWPKSLSAFWGERVYASSMNSTPPRALAMTSWVLMAVWPT